MKPWNRIYPPPATAGVGVNVGVGVSVGVGVDVGVGVRVGVFVDVGVIVLVNVGVVVFVEVGILVVEDDDCLGVQAYRSNTMYMKMALCFRIFFYRLMSVEPRFNTTVSTVLYCSVPVLVVAKID